MNRFFTMAAVAVAFAMTAPASATWYSGGDHEPDNPLDNGLFNWHDAPGAHQNRIYFNVYSQETTTGANPNVGAAHTRFDVIGQLHFEAHFGVWVDCNGDGYIGMAESAVREYRSELLRDDSICPPTKGHAHNPDPATWNPHNYNGWVTELIPIGRSPVGGDKRVIVDDEAMVWGDIGYPYPTGPEHVQAAQGGSCPIMPFPRGTWRSTGGAIDYADCFAAHRLGQTYNQAVVAAGQDGLALKNASTWKEPGHPLNIDTFGAPEAESGAIQAQDCTQKPIVTVGGVVGNNSLTNDFAHYGIRAPPANVVKPGGSVAGSWNATHEAVREDCDTSNDKDGDFYLMLLFEGEHEGQAASHKTKATYNFGFSPMSRGGAPLGGLTGKAGAPSDAGIELMETAFAQQSEWNAGVSFVGNTPALVRGSGSLSQGTYSVHLANATFFSFYAFVGDATLSKGYVTPGNPASYAGPFCPTGFGSGAGTHYGWECEASKWYVQENGEPMTETFTLARPGQTYQFRDVDCFDGGFDLDGIEAGIFPAFYSVSPCARPVPSSSGSTA